MQPLLPFPLHEAQLLEKLEAKKPSSWMKHIVGVERATWEAGPTKSCVHRGRHRQEGGLGEQGQLSSPRPRSAGAAITSTTDRRLKPRTHSPTVLLAGSLRSRCWWD